MTQEIQEIDVVTLQRENDQLRASIALLEQNPTSQPQSILQQADAIAGQDRSRDYGHPYENHLRIAAFWNVQLEKKLTAPIEPREVALMMVSLKLAREINTPKRDNLIDMAGYVKCVDMIDERSE